MHTSASFEKLLREHGHYLDDLSVITLRYVNYLEEQYEKASIQENEIVREYKEAGNAQFDAMTYSCPWCDDERWNEVRDTMDAIEDEVDELYKIVEGMDYI